VLAGARSLVAIGEWAADAPQPAWRRAVAVDGKTLRGSGHHGHAQVHLLAAMDHTSCAVLGQTDVDHTTNEIARFRPLLDGLDLAGRVITADALHTHRDHPDWLVTAKHAAYVLIVKTNQPTLHCQLATLPWRDIPAQDHTRDRGHHRGVAHIRDTTFAEDASQTRTDTTPGPWRACATSSSPSCACAAGATSPPRCAATPATPPESCHSLASPAHETAHLHPRRGPARAAHQRPPDPVVHGLLRVPMTVCAGRPG